MEDLTLSSSNYSAKGSQSEALGLKGRFYPNRLHSLPLSACMEYEDILSDKQRPTTYS